MLKFNASEETRMVTTLTANRMTTSDTAVMKLALRAYLAGLAAAATLVRSATVLADFGLKLAFG